MPPPAADNRHIPGGNQRLQRLQASAVHGTIYYAPRNPVEHRRRAAPTFPTPHIRARQRRPLTIHIVSYPPGYIPSELRSLLRPAPPDTSNQSRNAAPPSTPPLRRKRTFQASTVGQAATKRRSHRPRRRHSTNLARNPATDSLAKSLPPLPSARARVFEKLISAFSAQPAPALTSESPQDPSLAEQRLVPVAPVAPTTTRQSRPNSFLSLGRRLSLHRTHSHGSTQLPAVSPATTNGSAQNTAAATMPADILSFQSPQRATRQLARNNHALSEQAQPVSMLAAGQNSHRNSFISVQSVKNIMTSSVSEVMDKPIAAAGGMSFDIILAEPHVFLNGFDQDSRTRHNNHDSSAMLRGKLRLVVTKNVKIRAVAIKLQGKARTDWPEGLPPLKVDFFEEDSLRTMNVTFFNAMHGSWTTPYGNMCAYSLKNAPDNSLTAALNKLTAGSSLSSDSTSLSSGMSARDIKRLSLQQVQSRSFGKDDSPMVQPTQAKGYKVFYPGTYEYTFEFPIDHHQLETIKLPFGSVKWELEGAIERAGAFKPNLHGIKNVSIIRVPDQLSLETVEPISITRQWEDQLFYDIIISGKSFPIGGKIPIAFKLTPLAKVQLHKLKVYVTESTEYWTTNRRVTRKDPGRKILLFEKAAGKPIDSQYQSSEINFTTGGELTAEQRREARDMAARRRNMEAQRTNTVATPLPDATDNLLGDLDLGLETYWGSTELEMNVQIPTCKQMAREPNVRLHPDCSWRNATVYHWIKVVLRISRADPDDPTGQRRRHFEISIDSPFTILNCLASQANTALPRYTGTDMSFADCSADSFCGCADASTSAATSPTGSISFSSDTQNQQMPVQPQAAHLHQTQATTSSDESMSMNTPSSSSQSSLHQSAHTEQDAYESPRPIHLLRVPSYAPPAFDADDSPPLPADVMTPPPNYDAIVGTPSVDGLADYFSRLADYDDTHDTDTIRIALEDESDSDGDNLPSRITSRGGRVNVANPRTPGGLRHAPSRSMDIQRPAVPFHLHMASPLRPAAD